MVNPEYKTITYDSTAAELDLNTWYSNGPTDVNASKIILSNNLTWDIKWQIVVFAKQELVFDGNGKTITLAKDTGGAGTSPNNFRGLLCVVNAFLPAIADVEDYYGINVKNLIIDSTTNSIGLEFGQSGKVISGHEHTSNLENGCGYLFGSRHNSSQGWGGASSGGGNIVNSRITPTTKNTFICNKVQIKAYFSPNTTITNWLTWQTGFSTSYQYSVPTVNFSNLSGSFAGQISGRCKFINCMANGRFHGYSSLGYLEFVNCLTTNNSLLSGVWLNRHSHNYLYQIAHQKYIFENCVAYKLFDTIYDTTTHTDIVNAGKLLEISGCKVESNYWSSDPGSTHRLVTNSSTGYDYLDDTTYEIKPSENNNILEVINVDGGFMVENNIIEIKFSPYIGISIDDYLAVKAIDLSTSSIILPSYIPNTWFNNLKGDIEEAKEKEIRRHQLIDTILTNNTNIVTFDISRSVMSMTKDSIKDTYRVFKVIDASANVDLRDLSENTGFYIPLNTDKDKVKLTTRDNDITFEIKRDGVDINGNNIYYIEKKSGTANLTIDRDSSITIPISSTIETTNITTTSTTSTTSNSNYNNTSNSNSGGQTSTNNACLSLSTTINVISFNGNKYVFNGDSSYDSTKKYGLYTATYTFKDIPEAHPLAILNNGNSNISYTGNNSYKFSKSVSGTTSDGTYDFYYGDITVTVTGDFSSVSVYCYYHGYMGGENLLEYKYSCSY